MLAVIFGMISMNVFAADVITGTVLLNGNVKSVSVDTNTNTGKQIVLDGVTFKITQINADNIRATNGRASVDAYVGSAFREGILSKNSQEIVEALGLKNGKEVECDSTRAKAFIVRTDAAGKAIGNCIY